eukprot:scaffold114696_cov18-Tisochrysis_lutea.AAC.1
MQDLQCCMSSTVPDLLFHTWSLSCCFRLDRCCTQPRGSAADVPLFSDYGVSTAPLHTAPGGAADVPRFGLPTMITVQSVILIDHTVSCLALSSPARGAPAAGLCAVCLCLCRICSLLEGPGLLMRGFRSHWAGARQAGGVDA